jgi:hypothetical protein
LVPDVSFTVASTPLHVEIVKLDEDVVSMMPVAPPSAGPDRAPVWVGAGVGVVEVAAVAWDVDGDKTVAAAMPDPASTAAADISPVPMIQPAFFFGVNRFFMVEVLSFDDNHSLPADCWEIVVRS